MTKKIAVVTGGTRGIGAAISMALQQSGYKVAANYASNDQRAEAFFRATGIPVYRWDVSNYEACRMSLDNITKDLEGDVDVLVNNAGITRDVVFHKMSPEQWHEVIATNLSSVYNMTKYVIDSMRKKGFGRIINIASINGQKGQFGQVNYAVSKSGMIGFTKSLALETAKFGITVNAIAPGYINTDMVQGVSKDILDNIVANIPVGRLGTPEEVARCAVFLASEESQFITGSTLTVNGGQYMV